jgi:hypothetical protein
VPTETQKIAMQLDADIRLAAAAGGVGRYFADAAGLANGVVSGVQSAIIGVCQREIEQLKDAGQRLDVTVTRSPDRIEVVVSRAAGAPENKPERPGTIAGVDQVHHETRSDIAITRLTKYVSESAAGR